MSAIEIQIHLKALQVERALASTEGLTANAVYMADLDHELAVTGRGIHRGRRHRDRDPACRAVRAAGRLRGRNVRTAANFELPVALDYIESTLPRDMTILQYRRSRPRRHSRIEWLKQIAGGWGRLVA